MQPDWQTEDGAVQLYCGDVLEILPGLDPESVDCILADPPYSSGGLHKAARSRSINDKYVTSGATIQYSEFSGDARDQRSWTRWCAEWMRDCLTLARPNRYLLSFCDWRQLPGLVDAIQWADWTWNGIIPWDKGDGARAGNTSMFRHQCEYVAWGTKGGTAGYKDRSGPWPGVVRCTVVSPNDRDHQSEKPVEILQELLACCLTGESVLDPFMGSGSTGVAAVSRGLRFIGIELDRSHFATAVKRIKAELGRMSLFEPVVKTSTKSLFGSP